MTNTQTLTRHRDIQTWVTERKGMPAIVRGHDSWGKLRARLALKFDRTRRPEGMPHVDQGVAPVSWSAWLAELDRQQLALRVTPENDYEFVERKSLN